MVEQTSNIMDKFPKNMEKCSYTLQEKTNTEWISVRKVMEEIVDYENWFIASCYFEEDAEDLDTVDISFVLPDESLATLRITHANGRRKILEVFWRFVTALSGMRCSCKITMAETGETLAVATITDTIDLIWVSSYDSNKDWSVYEGDNYADYDETQKAEMRLRGAMETIRVGYDTSKFLWEDSEDEEERVSEAIIDFCWKKPNGGKGAIRAREIIIDDDYETVISNVINMCETVGGGANVIGKVYRCEQDNKTCKDIYEYAYNGILHIKNSENAC